MWASVPDECANVSDLLTQNLMHISHESSKSFLLLFKVADLCFCITVHLLLNAPNLRWILSNIFSREVRPFSFDVEGGRPMFLCIGTETAFLDMLKHAQIFEMEKSV